MAIKTDINDLLLQHKLRKTPNRAAILGEFLKTRFALSHGDLEQTLSDFDRVTIYRTLSSFVEQGLIHKVMDDSGTTKYALCSEHCSEHRHDDAHVHFSCNKCGHTFCLDHMPVPEPKLPRSYVVQDYNFLIQGVCKNCNTRK
jgi:Fur family transcriptional regulator, ferric uptake regulator